MRLSVEDVKLFYKLLYPLQFYTKEKLELLPEVKTEEEYRKLTAQQKLEVRDALYAHPELFDEFIQQNPAHLNNDELAIIRSWKQFVKGDFFIERFLKKYSIWIGDGSPSPVYGVLGIMESLDEIIHPSYLPLRVHAVLLPWKGQIVYDGVFQSYNVLFGSGIRDSLREAYMAAKQNGRIIESLTEDTQAELTKKTISKPVKGWTEEAESLVQLANTFKGQNVSLHSETFSLLKAVALLTQTVVTPASDVDSIWAELKKVRRALSKLETALERTER